MEGTSEHAIRTNRLTKYYGKTRGIEGLDLGVERGQIFGFLGPNGAGKTTTIRTLLDLIRPTSGRAEVLGLDAQRDSLQIRSRVGYLPGEFSLYDHTTGVELLDFFADLRGGISTAYGRELAERLEVDLSRRIGTLSKGNKQKVALVQAMMHRPELLILDEPTSGLDPLVQHTVHTMLENAAIEGRTVFLSSHVLSEIEHMAHRVGIIRAGRLIIVEEVADLKGKAARRFEVHFSTSVPADAFANLSGVREADVSGTVGHFMVEGSPDAFLKVITRYEVVDLITHEPDLEEVFLTFYRETDDAA